MKNILLIIISLFLFTGWVFTEPLEINTNTTLSISNVLNEVQDTKLIVGEWKEEITNIKTNGFGVMALLSILLLCMTSLMVIGVVLVMLLNLIEFFTPAAIDIKLQKVEDWLTKYFIKLPATIISYFKTGVKKKP